MLEMRKGISTESVRIADNVKIRVGCIDGGQTFNSCVALVDDFVSSGSPEPNTQRQYAEGTATF